jgi:hypothetical protein
VAREASFEGRASDQSRAGFRSGGIVVDAGERIRSQQCAGSGCAVARRSDSRNYAARGRIFRGQFGDIPCLRQRKPRQPAARLRLWWWLLPVRASALVCVRKGCLFATSDQSGAQVRSEKAIIVSRGRGSPQIAPVIHEMWQRDYSNVRHCPRTRSPQRTRPSVT